MRCRLFLLILTALAQSVFSQDLIVTSEGNSLNCRITKITSKEIYYIFIQDGVVRDSSLSKQSVIEYKFNKFAVNDTLMAIKIDPKNNYHYRAALNVGSGSLWNYFLDNSQADLASYYANLESGIQLSGDVTYYISGALGVGLKYSQFNTKNSAYLVDEDHVQTGIMSDDLSITFIGPSVSTRFPSINGNNGFLMDFSVGYMTFTDDIVFNNKYSEKGSTVGLSLGLGYDISISRNFAMGIQLSMYAGRLSEFVRTNYQGSTTIRLSEGNYERLERMDLSVGLRFLK